MKLLRTRPATDAAGSIETGRESGNGDAAGHGARPPFHLGYRPALDGVRGVAILAVLAVNSLLPFGQGGFIGVDIFFVLSGFLITSLLMEEWAREGRISLKRFYARRALRLLPALFVLLGASCAYGLLFQSKDMASATWKEAGWVFFYVANWMLTIHHEMGSLDHAWSLAVEEQFYLIWPLVFLFLLRRRLRREQLLAILGLGIALSLGWRSFLWHQKVHYLRLYYGSDTRADALLIGCFLGVAFATGPGTVAARGKLFRALSVFGAAGVLGWTFFFARHDDAFLYQGGFTLIALAAAALIAEAAQFPKSTLARGLSIGLLVWVGRISYSLYLWHYPVFHVLRVERFAALGLPAVAIHAGRFAAVFAAACASYYLVEQPFLRRKNKIRSGVPALPPREGSPTFLKARPEFN